MTCLFGICLRCSFLSVFYDSQYLINTKHMHRLIKLIPSFIILMVKMYPGCGACILRIRTITTMNDETSVFTLIFLKYIQFHCECTCNFRCIWGFMNPCQCIICSSHLKPRCFSFNQSDTCDYNIGLLSSIINF